MPHPIPADPRSDPRFVGPKGKHFHLIAELDDTRALCRTPLTAWTNRALANLAEQRLRANPSHVPCEACIRIRDGADG